MKPQPSNTPPAEVADEAVQTENDVDLAETPEEILGTDESPEAALDAVLDETESEEAEETEEEESEEESASDTDSEQPEGDDEEGDENEEESEEEAPEGDEPTEDETPTSLTPDEIKALFDERRGLLHVKGKLGKTVGDARTEIARRDGIISHLSKRLAKAEGREIEDDDEAPEADEERIPQTKEEWDALFATEPLKATELYERVREEQKAQAAEEAKKQEQMEKVLVTPDVSVTIFKRANGIKNFDKWSESPEGVAVANTVAGNKRLKYAMLAAINTADPEEAANVMSEALQLVRGKVIVKKAVTVSKAQAAETQASKPKSVARPGRAVNPAPSKKLTEMSSDDILKLDNKTFAKLMSGR